MLILATLAAAGIGPRVAQAFCEPLALACERFDIRTPARVAAFVSQCAFESRGFVTLEDGMLYRTPERICAMWPERVRDLDDAERLVGAPQALANTVLCGCHGNGDAASGDGWRYRGRGLIRLVGRATYCAAGEGLQRPYEQQPDLVARPQDACLTAAWFWHSRGFNEMADRLQFDAITRFIHEQVSPMGGLYERRALYRGALAALEDMRC
jgi:putative chitinase